MVAKHSTALSTIKSASWVVEMVKNLPEVQETWVQSLGWEDPWRRAWLPTPVPLPGEFHGQRNLVGYSPWVGKESDRTEQLTHRHTPLSHHRLWEIFTVFIKNKHQ